MIYKNFYTKTYLRATGGTSLTVLSALNADLGLGVVPAGKRRYVTFLDIQNFYGGQQTLVFASCTTAVTSGSRITWMSRTTDSTRASLDAKASLMCKYRLQIQAREHVMIPPGGPNEETQKVPLFSIAPGASLQIVMNRGTCAVFLHYIDQ
jgi:hypothetical protein